MSTAKPQQPSGQQDSPDDLIAELARMMATGAQGGGRVAAPVTPATDARVEPSIAPRAEAVRIPGQEAAADTSSRFNFDFGTPPKAPSVAAPEPLLSWQERLGRTPAPAAPAAARIEPTLAPVPEPALEASRFESAGFEPEKFEPEKFEPEPSQDPEPQPSFVAPSVPEFEERFEEPESAPQPDVEALEPEPQSPVEDDGYDAIAELIAAEFDAPATAETPPAPEPEPEPQAAKPLLRAVNYAVEPKPPGDRFSMPPVFGVGTTATEARQPVAPQSPVAREPALVAPTPVEARAPLDPMDEIESLIGAAIKGDTAPRSEPMPPAAPSRPAFGRDTSFTAPSPSLAADKGQAAAEAAILAAAAATGAEVGRVQTVTPPPQEQWQKQRQKPERKSKPPRVKAARPPRERRESAGMRPFIGPAIAGTLLLVAAFGVYWFLGMSHTDGVAPVLTADTSPTKQAPATPPASTNPTESSAVFNELDGVKPTDNAEQLVSRDQSTGAEETPTPPPQTTQDGLANRKVRTVTVRPDGSIVNGDDALAGAEPLPVARPNVPNVPGGSLDASDLLTAAAQSPAGTPNPAPVTATIPAPQATPTTAAVLPPGATPTPPDVVAPIPRPRIANRQALAQQAANASAAANGNGATADLATPPQTLQPASRPAATATPAAAPKPGSPAPAYVQLSSQRDETVARQSLIDINARWGNLLKGTLPEVQRVDLGAKGVYYRVRVPTDSLQSANYLCSQIKANGGDCYALN
ncbi:MAG TPA: hypothetical protein VGM83_09475 [Devosiaceae bacterium]|jgi:hypothetical protein